MIEDLLKKQQELMEKVPHDVRPGVYPLMIKSVSVIERLLIFLGSCGHKPWRPNPLDPNTRDRLMADFGFEVERIRALHSLPENRRAITVDKRLSRQVISTLGVIEESIEYLVSINTKGRQEQLEEITDVLFFYLEQVILGEFTWTEIEKEYVRKHAVNLKRYEDAKKGEYGWDHRDKGGL